MYTLDSMVSHHSYLIVGTSRSSEAFIGSWCSHHAISLSGNPDVFFVSGETATVEIARSVVVEASRAPIAGEYRIIVWKLGYLSEEVSNTLLKVLEELPEKTRMFICVPPGTEILGTVLSRVHLELLPFGEEDLAPIKKFLGMTVADRLAYLEKEFFKSEASDVRVRMLELLSGIAEILSAQNSPELPEIVPMISFLNQGSATPKYILEYTAHAIPEKVKF